MLKYKKSKVKKEIKSSERKREISPVKVGRKARARDAFLIVGIGASAGGLEALEP
jgi:chemotaxis response regulator CheB